MDTDNEVVLVLGGTGLVGYHIKLYVESLKGLNIDEPKDDNERIRKLNIESVKNKKFVFVGTKEGDFSNYEQASAIFKKYNPKWIINLAARVGGLYENMSDKGGFLDTNLKIGTNIINLSHDYKVKKLVNTLSSCIFPDKVTYPITEDLLHNGPPHHSNEGYAYAKRTIEIMGRIYAEQYGDKIVSVIPTNVYGGNDNFNLKNGHVFPGLIHKAYLAKKNNEALPIFGTGSALRQFIYAFDLAEIMIWALFNYEDKLPLTISVGEKGEISIADLTKSIVEVIGLEKGVKYDPSYSDGQHKKTTSNDKLMGLIHDYKFTPVKKGIEETYKWFAENYETTRK